MRDEGLPDCFESGQKFGNLSQMLDMLLRYKAFADDVTYRTTMSLPPGEALKARQSRFGNIVHTLNHIYVVEDIFRHHLEGRPHSYTARNTEAPPPIEALWSAVQGMNRWYIGQVQGWSDDDLAGLVRFTFVGGGEGAMTRAQIILHVVNHGTYHRGLVSDMMYQVPLTPPSTDLPVFLRDHDRACGEVMS